MVSAHFNSLNGCTRHWRERCTIPGIVVGVYRDGDISLHADGTGHLVADWPMRADNLFRIASITKVFTATAAMMLVDEGRLDLDEPVSSYLPDFSLADEEAAASITMRHLLSHASGIYGDFFDDFGSDDGALAREVAHLRNLRQLTRPGELWHYCNSGFDLAGHVVATIAGTSYESFIRERMFGPLGMERAGFFAHEMIARPHAVGHDPLEPLSEEHRVANQHYPRNNNPSGAVITNAEELLRFAAMHLSDGLYRETRLLSEGSTRAMRQPQIESGDFADHWGIGWEIREYGGTVLYGHGGSTNGFQSQLTLIPEQNAAFVIWTNSGRGRLAINPVEAWMLEHEFGLIQAAPEPVELPAEQLRRLAGRYANPLGEVTIEVEDGALRLRMVVIDPEQDRRIDMPEAVARPLSADRFAVMDGPFSGESINFFPRGADQPQFLRRHGRLFDRV